MNVQEELAKAQQDRGALAEQLSATEIKRIDLVQRIDYLKSQLVRASWRCNILSDICEEEQARERAKQR